MERSDISYLDLELRIERAEEGYRAQVAASPAGQASTDFTNPFSERDLDYFRLLIGRPRRGVRRVEASEMEAVKSFGGDLFDAVFRGDVLGCLRRSLDEADREEKGLRIRLNLAGAPELTDLPWEYLYHRSLEDFLSLSKNSPLVRYLDLPERIRPLIVKPPLRVLVMISSRADHEPLDVEREWQRLNEALHDLQQRGLVALHRLAEPTLPALQRQLRRKEYHVFHFIGHGGFTRADEGVLVLEDAERRAQVVSAHRLGITLRDERSLRLAIINACEGARSSQVSPFSGMAQGLVQRGIPAVIAMQFEITDRAAVTFSHEFYTALAEGYPVDAALGEARKMIYNEGNELEWGTPVLYMRSPDGRIFDFDEAPVPAAAPLPAPQVSEEERRHRMVLELEQAAQAALRAEEWPEAIERLQELRTLAPTHAEAQAMLSRARGEQERAQLYAAASEHQQAGRLREALEGFVRVRDLGGSYRDVEARIAAIEQELREQVHAEKETPIPEQRWREYAVPVIGGVLALVLAIGVIRSLMDGERPQPPPALAELRITGELPAGVQVRVNGVAVSGETLSLAPGRYRIEIRAQGYPPLDSVFTLAAGDQRIWSLPPPPPPDTSAPPPAPPGELRITGTLPAGARVLLNGEEVSERVLSLRPGERHVVRVAASGFTDDSAAFTLGEGEERSWTPQLRRVPPPPPARAQLRITGTLPAGAQVQVDGQRVSGTTLSLEPGSRRIRITAPGFETLDTTFTLAAGDQRSWSPRLRRTETREETVRRINELVAAYASALEAQNLGQVRSLYPAMTAPQQRFWGSLFQSVHGIRVTVSHVGEPAIEGNTARVDFTLLLSYRDSGGARQDAMNHHAVLTRQSAGGWRFQSMRY